MKPPIQIDDLLLILADFPDIRLVYLFGSRVSGHLGPMSDYDVAICSASLDDAVTIQAGFQHALITLLGTKRVDVVILDHAPIELAYHVISTGKLLYKKDTCTRVEFEAQVLGKYGDYLPVLRSFRDQTLQGDAHGKRVQRYREALGRTQRALSQARTPPRSRTR